MDILLPPDWPKPKGYAEGIAARGRLVAIAGMVGRVPGGPFAPDFVGQARRAFANILAVLAQAGGRPEHLVRMTWFVRDRDEYVASLKDLGLAYREAFGRNYPAMTLVQVAALLDAEARLEIEATAVIPDGD